MPVTLRPWQPPGKRKPRKRMQGSATARGYGSMHKRFRIQWKPVVDAGYGFCHAVICLVERDGGTRWIEPGTPWHLGHTPDRTAWTGPEHARCNLSDGAVRGNKMRTPQHRRHASRAW
jgi:hypothetical protein